MCAVLYKRSALEKLVLLVNTAGFLIYLAWIMTGAERIFYTRDGVLYLLPCLPFFFVYALLFGAPRKSIEKTKEGSSG